MIRPKPEHFAAVLLFIAAAVLVAFAAQMTCAKRADAATVLSLTLPAYERNTVPDSTGRVCGASIVPLGDLSRLRVWAVQRYSVTKVLVAEFDVRGLEGQPVQVVFNDQGHVCTVWATTVDLAGNESCHSNHIGVNLAPGIPDPWMHAQCMCDP